MHERYQIENLIARQNNVLTKKLVYELNQNLEIKSDIKEGECKMYKRR